MKIAFVTPPFSGHLNRLIPLAEAARDRGDACVFFTGAAKLPAIAARGFPAAAPESVAPDAMEAIANWHTQTSARPWAVVGQFRRNLEILPLLQQDLVAFLERESPDVVVADFIAAIVAKPCAAMRLPWITTIGTPFAIENRTGVPTYLGGWAPMPGLGGAMRDAAGRFVIRSFKRLVFATHRRQLRPMIDRLYRPDGSEAIYSPSSMLGFGMTELEFPRDWPSSFEMIGPVFGALEDGPELVLPPARRHVFASIGTHLFWAKDRLVADVIALARRFGDWHFTVTLGQPEKADMPPEQIASNVTLRRFVPYHRDLQRFDMVIHHGGSGIAYATIHAGLPSLIVPHDYDQFDYAARMVHHGLGLSVRRLAGTDAALAFERLADRSSFPALESFREAAARYRPRERFLAAVDRVTATVGEASRRALPIPDRQA